MSYAPGGSLAQLLRGGQRLPVHEALRLFRQITEALAYVHAKGVRHCDLKPGNVLLDARGRALIGDFGQAHLASDASPALGTFFYMAPEQATLGDAIPDTRWDVYGLGALFYAMLTGAPPREQPEMWEGGKKLSLEQRLERYRAAVAKVPRPAGHRGLPGMDGDLAAVLDRCLELDPGKRFHDAGAVLGALARRDRARRRRPLLVFGLAAPLVLILLMTGLAARNGQREIDRAADHLAAQLQESDRVSARLVANVVQEELQDRIDLLEDFRADHRDELLRYLQQRDGPRLRALLKALHGGGRRKVFSQYAIADRDGYILAGYPFRAERIFDARGRPRRWAFRDWFNGRGDQRQALNDWYEPVRSVHVSEPYKSQIPGREYLCVNVTVPLFASDGRTVAGVLTGQIVVHELHGWLEGVEIADGYVVLLNERGQCLKHPSEERIEPDGQGPKDWRAECDLYRRALSDDPGDGLARYTDPINGKACLGGYGLFPERKGKSVVGWLALVQHDEAAALRPVGQLRRNLWINCALALLVGVVLTTGLWGWMVRALHREERAGT
jgi:hypothetical protein